MIRTLDIGKSFDVNVYTCSGKKITSTKQLDTDFPNPKKEKDQFLETKAALEVVDCKAKAKNEEVIS